MKVEFPPQTFFDKFSNTKFHKNPPSDTRVVPRGQTNKHDEEKARISQIF